MLTLLLACAPQPVTLATYNAGLAVSFVPAAEERAPLVADQLAGLDADVVCLQEVWLSEHVDQVAAATADAFPYTLFPDPQQETSDTQACVAGELDEIVACVEENCTGTCDDALADCALQSCAIDFLGLDKPCQSCVMAHVADPADVIEQTCSEGDASYAFDGAFGTGILSRHEILDSQTTVFDSTTNRRGALRALVDSPLGELDVYCTHLTAIFALIPYPKESGSWEDEQAAQIDDLRAWIEDTRGAEAGVVLMGDTNNGPYIAGQAERYPEHYAALAEGFDDPYVDQVGECTICEDNGFRASGEGNAVIDHVLLKGVEGSTSARRILDEHVQVQTCGETIEGNYSDHYGVSVTVTPE